MLTYRDPHISRSPRFWGGKTVPNFSTCMRVYTVIVINHSNNCDGYATSVWWISSRKGKSSLVKQSSSSIEGADFMIINITAPPALKLRSLAHVASPARNEVYILLGGHFTCQWWASGAPTFCLCGWKSIKQMSQMTACFTYFVSYYQNWLLHIIFIEGTSCWC